MPADDPRDALAPEDWEEYRKEHGWPTPNHMRRTADALDILTPAKYGDVLRWVADACDAALPLSPAQAAEQDRLAALGKAVERMPDHWMVEKQGDVWNVLDQSGCALSTVGYEQPGMLAEAIRSALAEPVTGEPER